MAHLVEHSLDGMRQSRHALVPDGAGGAFQRVSGAKDLLKQFAVGVTLVFQAQDVLAEDFELFFRLAHEKRQLLRRGIKRELLSCHK